MNDGEGSGSMRISFLSKHEEDNREGSSVQLVFAPRIILRGGEHCQIFFTKTHPKIQNHSKGLDGGWDRQQ